MSKQTKLRKRFPGLVRGSAAVFLSLAAAVALPPERSVAEYADQYRKVSAESGSPYPGDWKTDLVPYTREIMECLSFSDPCTSVTFVKSAQVAGTEVGINLFCYVVGQDPCPIVIVLPTLDESKKYVSTKLQPAIDATPHIRHRVREQTSRDSAGSTMANKKFRGGFCQITGANSSRGLQMISARVLIADELSEWPADVDGRGEPLALAEKRLTAWDTRGAKKYYVSTPGLAGTCRITDKYEASDMRRYYVPCPHCGTYQILRWSSLKARNKTVPYQAYYECARHGCVIEHHEKRSVVAKGVWIKTYPDDGNEPAQILEPEDLEHYRARSSNGRQPGFHIWQIYSPFVVWDTTIDNWQKADGDRFKEKVFTQQDLGEAYEETGDAPDYEKLFLRRQNYPLGRIPPGGLVLTGMADVQLNRIEWSVYAWGVGMTGWLIDKGIVEGDPSDEKLWREMGEIVERQYEDWQGNLWPVEAFGVDAGYLSNMVYNFSRSRQRVFALDGRHGNLLPAIGTPKKVDVKWNGKPIKGGALLWPTGTWPLKSKTYSALHKTIEGPDDEGQWPSGTMFFPDACDQEFFKQITAEYLDTEERHGRQVHVWKKAKSQANEALDIAVGARAMAAHLRLEDLDPAGWAKIAADRGAPPEQTQRDLAELWAPRPKGEEAPMATEDAPAASDSVRPETGSMVRKLDRAKPLSLVERMARINKG